MYRCIIFGQAFPEYLVQFRPSATYCDEASEPEQAMVATVEAVIGQTIPAWLRERTTWQPSTGIVFVNGKPCGTVFEVMSRGKIFEDS